MPAFIRYDGGTSPDYYLYSYQGYPYSCSFSSSSRDLKVYSIYSSYIGNTYSGFQYLARDSTRKFSPYKSLKLHIQIITTSRCTSGHIQHLIILLVSVLFMLTSNVKFISELSLVDLLLLILQC